MPEPADLADAAAALRREQLARCSTYAEAQAVLDHLADAGFPVEHAEVVGTDLRLVEQVYGRLGWARAAALAAGGGAWVGLLAAALLALFSGTGTPAALLLLWGVVLGGAFGGVAGAGGYALGGGDRDFVSRSQVVASSYEVTVETAYAARARELLAQHGPEARPRDAAEPG